MAFVHRTSPGSGVKRPLDSTSSGKANRVSRAICLNWNGARCDDPCVYSRTHRVCLVCRGEPQAAEASDCKTEHIARRAQRIGSSELHTRSSDQGSRSGFWPCHSLPCCDKLEADVVANSVCVKEVSKFILGYSFTRNSYYYVISSDPDALNVELFFLDLVTISPAIDLIAHFETPPNICFSLPMSALILFAPSLLTVLVNLLYLSDAANAMEAVLWNLVSPSLMRPTFFG
ncbi:hypothetical protein FB446DRAFT_795099 [Lentinula raphanica]|nr:hypothetical protein FB446DRAFT_795099 [Lentinula raphanica]